MASGLNWLWPSASQRRAGAVQVCRLFAGGNWLRDEGHVGCADGASRIRRSGRTGGPGRQRAPGCVTWTRRCKWQAAILRCKVARARPMERGIVPAGRHLRVMRRLFRLAIQGVVPGGGRDIREFSNVSHPGTPAIGTREYANVPIDIKQYGFFHDHPGTFQRSFR